MRRMDRLARLALCALPALLLPGCSGLDPEVTGASLLAYWSQSSSAIDCPDALGCVAFAESLQDFEVEVNAKRIGGMELVRIDAYKEKSKRLYAGAWAPADPQTGEHRYETALTEGHFEALHRQRAADGYRLVHVSIWRDGQVRRIAAVWRPGAPEEADLPDDVVAVGIGWNELHTRNAEQTTAGRFLDDIEVDPTSASGSDPFLIAVWRPGEVETLVLEGPLCSLRGEPIEPDSTVGETEPPCAMPDSGATSSEIAEHCPVLSTVGTLAQLDFHPVDFEPYVRGGDGNLAVLLQKRGRMDWLTVPGSWHAVHCRHELLGKDPVLGVDPTAVGLLDFDLVGLGPAVPTKGLHNGLVHDGGTAGGPPGGGSGLVAADVTDAEPAPDAGSAGGGDPGR